MNLWNDLKPYAEMKDSGLPWLGEVPEHWDVRRIRHIVDMRVSNVDKHIKDGETPVRLCNYVDVYKNERITARLQFMSGTATSEEVDKFQLAPGDVLITKDSEVWNDIGVPALVANIPEGVICGYHLALMRPRLNFLNGAYLHRALQSVPVAYQFHIAANGITRYGLSQNAIKSALLPLPPPSEQSAIVQFLDYMDGKIGRLIRVKKRMIGLLNEQKLAIIHRAVTRGIDPDVSLKPSGIDWLGDVPKHWDVLRARYLFKEVDRRSQTGRETHLSMSQKLGLVASDMVERTLTSASYIGGKLCKVDDLVLNRLKAHLGVFALARQSGVISPDYTVLRRTRLLDVRYFERVLRSPACRTELRIRAKGIVEGFWRLYTDDFNDIRLPVPPNIEQKSIVQWIETETQELNRTQDRIGREISLLKELRKDGGWTGSIHTLTINAKVRLVPNDNRDSENAPVFRVFVGRSRIGDAWAARSGGDNPKDYFRVRLDDPSLPEPFTAALFPSEDGNEAQLVWSRRKA